MGGMEEPGREGSQGELREVATVEHVRILPPTSEGLDPGHARRLVTANLPSLRAPRESFGAAATLAETDSSKCGVRAMPEPAGSRRSRRAAVTTGTRLADGRYHPVWALDDIACPGGHSCCTVCDVVVAGGSNERGVLNERGVRNCCGSCGRLAKVCAICATRTCAPRGTINLKREVTSPTLIFGRGRLFGSGRELQS